LNAIELYLQASMRENVHLFSTNPRKGKIIQRCALVIGVWWWLDTEWFEETFGPLWHFISFWAVMGWIIHWYNQKEED
jgi:hypothetical protein